ncbi:MAG: hypothetical protein PHU33_16470 [Bacteroidales bacterium]|nr:hypothetical protein [Bacteroidales bacterium]
MDKNILKSSIKQAFLDQRNKTDNPEAAIDDLAGKIADAVDVFIKGLVISYTSGLVAGPYPVTGTFNYSLS